MEACEEEMAAGTDRSPQEGERGAAGTLPLTRAAIELHHDGVGPVGGPWDFRGRPTNKYELLSWIRACVEDDMLLAVEDLLRENGAIFGVDGENRVSVDSEADFSTFLLLGEGEAEGEGRDDRTTAGDDELRGTLAHDAEGSALKSFIFVLRVDGDSPLGGAAGDEGGMPECESEGCADDEDSIRTLAAEIGSRWGLAVNSITTHVKELRDSLFRSVSDAFVIEDEFFG